MKEKENEKMRNAHERKKRKDEQRKRKSTEYQRRWRKNKLGKQSSSNDTSQTPFANRMAKQSGPKMIIEWITYCVDS